MNVLDFLVLLDAEEVPFVVADSTIAFPPKDAKERMKVEGMEEDGVKGTPAAVARRQLVADLRDQAARVAIQATGSNATPKDLREAAKKYETPDDQAMAQAEILGPRLIHAPELVPIKSRWVAEFNRMAEANIDAATIEKLMQKTTAEHLDQYRVGDSTEMLLRDPTFDAARATMIMRTESAKAFMERRLAQMERGSRKRWIASPDACELCLKLHGVELKLQSGYDTGALFGIVLTPPAHPNCRCSIEEVKQ
jgi:hypothetical protein